MQPTTENPDDSKVLLRRCVAAGDDAFPHSSSDEEEELKKLVLQDDLLSTRTQPFALEDPPAPNRSHSPPRTHSLTILILCEFSLASPIRLCSGGRLQTRLPEHMNRWILKYCFSILLPAQHTNRSFGGTVSMAFC